MYIYTYANTCMYYTTNIHLLIYTHVRGSSRLREIFLKTDNKLEGLYMAQITQVEILKSQHRTIYTV